MLTRTIKRQVREISTAQKKKLVLIIDEASLLRLDVFAELHAITQFDGDSKPLLLPIILAGQNNLADLLIYRTSLPLASRVVARTHLMGVSKKDMEAYILHHLMVAGVKQNLFADAQSLPYSKAQVASSGGQTIWQGALSLPPQRKNPKWWRLNMSASLQLNDLNLMNANKERAPP